MADAVRVPPSEDFVSFNGLVTKQGEHLTVMAGWAGRQCSNTDGLDGLLSLLKPHVPEVGDHFGNLLRHCATGMGTITSKTGSASQMLRNQDQANSQALLDTFDGGAIPGVPDISTLPTPSGGFGNFADEAIVLKEPHEPTKHISPSTSTPRGLDAAKEKAHQQLTGAGNDVWIADKAFQFVTGRSFIEMLTKPLLGDWDRLMYLHDAYETLGDACYTVAGTLRKGSWHLGSEWHGDSGRAFDEYMFLWANGIGGIGDQAKVTAMAYKEGYKELCKLVQLIVSFIGKLIDNEIKKLAEDAAETMAVDAGIEAVGLGPEDPVADVVAGVWTASRMAKLYQDVRMLVNGIEQVDNYYKLIQETVKKLQTKLGQIHSEQNSQPWGGTDAGSLVQDVESHGFDFEKQHGWSAMNGTTRVNWLPEAR